ncbi:MAG TPA: Sjogren's syndrome/scleroderma autoantigen 1 family protein [Candidatus Methanoperedens sp.]
MTSKIDEDRQIQRITRLLEKGGTMLATHHECGAPMFRYQGKVLCPVCDYKDKDQDLKIEPSAETILKVVPPKETKAEAIPAKKLPVDYDNIALFIKNKILNIAAGLESETDLERVKSKMECIELGIKILNLLEH